MSTERLDIFIKDMEENDQIMIGGQLYQVIYKADLPLDETRYFQLHHLTSKLTMFLTMEENAPVTIRRPIKK